MNRFTSGFCFNEDGSMLFMVNTAYYELQDDETCLNLSCIFHGITRKKIDGEYEIMRADVEYVSENNWEVSIDFDENGKDEFRVYKVIDID